MVTGAPWTVTGAPTMVAATPGSRGPGTAGQTVQDAVCVWHDTPALWQEAELTALWMPPHVWMQVAAATRWPSPHELVQLLNGAIWHVKVEQQGRAGQGMIKLVH